jgi:hypothetical protein
MTSRRYEQARLVAMIGHIEDAALVEDPCSPDRTAERELVNVGAAW